MSAHHYFRDFSYCDSGMIPWLLISEMLSINPTPLSELVANRMAAYPVSGEINNKVKDPDAIIKQVEEIYGTTALECDYTDGLSITFADFRFNIRKSNTEPVLRLNVESRADQKLMEEKTEELLKIIQAG
jgi:phosphomannomutase